MPVKISGLSAGTALTGAEKIPAVQSGVTVYSLASQIGTYVRGLFTTTPATIAEGGTNAATAAAARASLSVVGLTGNETVAGNKTFSGDTVHTGLVTMTGKSVIEAEGASVASAATTNIWAGDGNTIHITGNTGPITSFGTALQAGTWMKVVFDSTPTLTHGANLNLPGGANITAAADDFAFVYADTTTQFDVLYFKKDGTAVVGTTVSAASQAEVDAGTVANKYIPPSLRRISLLATQLTTSGTSKDFTIPSGVREFHVFVIGTSGNGTSNYLGQLGDAGGIENAGYVGGASRGTSYATSTAGFLLSTVNAATSVITGVFSFYLVDAATFQWAAKGYVFDTATPEPYGSAGSKATSQEVSTFRLTFVNGTDAFDLGFCGLAYKF